MSFFSSKDDDQLKGRTALQQELLNIQNPRDAHPAYKWPDIPHDGRQLNASKRFPSGSSIKNVRYASNVASCGWGIKAPSVLQTDDGDWQEFLGYKVVLCTMYENRAVVLHILLYVNRKQAYSAEVIEYV